MDLTDLLVSLHVLSAVVWVGGAITVQIMAVRAQNTKDGARVAQLGGEIEWVGQHIFFPASMLLLLSGIWMVVRSYTFGQFWILFGLAGIAFSAITGAAFLGPETGRIKALMEARGFDDPEVMSRTARIFLISRIELVILVLVVLDMVTKPGL